jgi:hypothetical protein
VVSAFSQEVTAITWQIEILKDKTKKETEVDRKDAAVAGGGVAGNKVPNGDSAENRNQLEQIKQLAQMLEDQQALLKKLTVSITEHAKLSHD